ncbi:MAG: DUF1573 domain-containing protein [Sphingobacteriaceae bacterium]|nr:DUF1573 domain-containing protein [Sphingobacteriaceae bacterium]
MEKKPVDKQDLHIKNPLDHIEGIFCLNKTIAFVLLMVLANFSFSQTAEVKVDDAKQSFTTVPQGTVVKLNYVVTNIGTVPLLLKDFEVECSCTTAEFDDKPVLPGKSTTIVVKFDTKSAYERQDRVVYINCNTKDGYIKLRFKGNVLKKK